MATKVNRDYWSGTYSAVTDFNTGECYRLDGTLKDWIDNNKWDINNGDEFDLTVCPWGLPECSFSSMATPVFMKTGGFGSSSEVIVEIQESHRKNTPIFFNAGFTRTVTDSYNTDRARISNKRRIVGETEKSNTQTVKYTNTVENNTAYSLDEYGTGTAPVISFQYDSVRYVLGNIFLFDTTKTTNFSNTYSSTTYDDLYNLINTEPTGNKYLICGCFTNIYIRHLDSQNNTNFKIRCCGKAKVPEYLGKQYFDSEETEYIDLSRCLYRLGGFQGKTANGSYGYVYGSGSSMYSNEVPTIKTTKSLEFGCSSTSTCIANISSKRQIFDDVSYHWETRLYYFSGQTNGSGQRYELKTGDSMPIHSGDNSYYINPYTFLIIDSHTYDDNYKAMCAALRHELAFIGLPFATSQPSQSDDIGVDNIYVPVFDYDHMLTTGNYKSGADALQLPNASWGDVFDSSVPAYDPNYIPPEPEPEESDYGDTSNLGSARGLFPAGVNIYLMSRLDYNTFMSELNSYYANSTPDDWTLDFQGVNPSDYILNVYYTPYNFVKSENKAAVKIGNIELTTTAYELSQGSPGVDDPNKWKYFTYGTRTVTPVFYDFRDYDPYTKVELYLPLAGTVELDTNYVMNHDITIEYYFDLMTMSGVAAVYRDSMLYKTSDFKLGAQVPLLITNMGQIQNQITQLEFSQKQNNLRLATSAISSGISIASIVAGGEATTAQAVGAGGGAFSLASGIMKADEIDYQLKHTTPSVSVTGAAEPLNNYSVGQLTPKLIIKRPLMLNTLDNAIYSKTIGNSCCINTTLDTMNGLVVCSSVDTTGIQKEISTGVYISPTIDEVNMIKSTFGSGVIL